MAKSRSKNGKDSSTTSVVSRATQSLKAGTSAVARPLKRARTALKTLSSKASSKVSSVAGSVRSASRRSSESGGIDFYL